MPANDDGGRPKRSHDVTLIAGSPARHDGESSADELGMVLAPAVEAAAREAEFAAAGPTPPYPDDRTSDIRSPAAAGLRFGKYELLAEIGRGGMGVVYRARQNELDRIVAIKMILSSHLATAEQVGRFYAEARAAARIQSPHVVAVHDVGELHGQHYFAMEYVDGPSLAQLVRRGKVDPREAARIVAIVARAVGHLHDQGVVHRDLKPSNILLDADGRPRVTDFGLAKLLQAGDAMTHSGAIVGTPGYMAPEQAAGRGAEVGPLSDLYSLGAILYELLTGRPPFDEATPLDTLVQVLEGEPIPPSRIDPTIPRALEIICLKCLEKAPGSRYPHPAALAEDLDRFLRGEQVEARRLSFSQRIRRWARREPALVSRLSTLAICGSIVQADQFLTERLQARIDRRLLFVLAVGAAASIMFQDLLRRERWANVARYAWAAADMILFTTLVVVGEGMGTSLVSGYLLLIVASGLWFRERLVWFTAALAVVSYGSLVGLLSYQVSRWDDLHRHFLFLVILVVAGLIVAYQVKRVRALSQYYEHRPLP